VDGTSGAAKKRRKRAWRPAKMAKLQRSAALAKDGEKSSAAHLAAAVKGGASINRRKI